MLGDARRFGSRVADERDESETFFRAEMRELLVSPFAAPRAGAQLRRARVASPTEYQCGPRPLCQVVERPPGRFDRPVVEHHAACRFNGVLASTFGRP